MDRLQKKCVIASAGLHLLLVVILLIGPAFLSSRSQTDNLPILDFVPVKTVDALVTGGGNPNGRLPEPPPPRPQPKPAVQPAPQPVVEVPKPPQPEPTQKEIQEPSLELSSKKAKKIDVSTKVVTRKSNPDDNAKAQAQARAQELADRRRAADVFGKAASQIHDGMSSGTSIELKGPGGGGVPYANFLQAVKTVYDRAWVVPDGLTDTSGIATVSVTIARDGTVVSARITRSSGNAAVDRSVQVTLDRVKYAAPLPDNAKENQRTVTIHFDVRAKLALG